MLTLLRLPQTKRFEPGSALADGLRFAPARMPIFLLVLTGHQCDVVPSCPAALRWNQGYALRALRGPDTTGRRRARVPASGRYIALPPQLLNLPVRSGTKCYTNHAMATIKHNCPHCLTTDIALVAVAWTPLGQFDAVGHLACPRCNLPSGARIQAGQSPVIAAQLSSFAADPTTLGYKIVGFWPAAPAPLIPEFLPPEIERVYLQAERNFPTDGNEDAAGTMYRKALDIGLKKIDPSLTGMLGAKIKKPSAAGKLTSDIAEWSDQIRDLGNDAAHEEAPLTRKELDDLRGITEMVLRYLFTLPNMIKKRRGEKLPWET
jgi:hypothetical protein